MPSPLLEGQLQRGLNKYQSSRTKLYYIIYENTYHLFIYSFIIHGCSTSKGKSKDSKWENNKSDLYCIKDSNSAISIAKTVLIEKIGEESIKNEVFKAELINDTVWQIKNMDAKKNEDRSFKTITLGGGIVLRLNRLDCSVILMEISK